MCPWYWAHVRPLSLTWIPSYIGRRPWPCVYFTLRYYFILRSQETVFHVVPFRKSTHACCRTFFVGNAYISPLSPTLHKSRHGFLWTEFSTYNWRISTLSRASTLWTGFCEFSGGVCHPMDGKMKTISIAFTDQPRLCHRKHRNLRHHPCFRTMTNLQPRMWRPRCSSARATGTPFAPTADNCAAPYTLRSSDPSENFFARPSPSCSILTFRRPSFADHPRAFFSSGD